MTQSGHSSDDLLTMGPISRVIPAKRRRLETPLSEGRHLVLVSALIGLAR
jgi:hypothetical protein